MVTYPKDLAFLYGISSVSGSTQYTDNIQYNTTFENKYGKYPAHSPTKIYAPSRNQYSVYIDGNSYSGYSKSKPQGLFDTPFKTLYKYPSTFYSSYYRIVDPDYTITIDNRTYNSQDVAIGIHYNLTDNVGLDRTSVIGISKSDPLYTQLLSMGYEDPVKYLVGKYKFNKLKSGVKFKVDSAKQVTGGPVTVELHGKFNAENVYANNSIFKNSDELVGFYFPMKSSSAQGIETFEYSLEYKDDTSSSNYYITLIYKNKDDTYGQSQAFKNVYDPNQDYYRTQLEGLTINISEPQPVPKMFYDWFIENTEKLDMDINLYQNSAEPNRLDKGGFLESVGTLAGTLRNETSVTNVVMQIEYTKFPDFNYVYLAMFNRYYYVDDIISIRNNLWEIHLSVDVLMTYKDAIRKCVAYVDRTSAGVENKDIPDDRLVIIPGYSIIEFTIPNDIITSSGESGSYVLNGFLFTYSSTNPESAQSDNSDTAITTTTEDGGDTNEQQL